MDGMNVIHLFMLLFSLGGLFVSWYINHKKENKEKLVCIVGKDCDIVVHSKWSSTFGISNEVFGMLYYALAAVASALLLLHIDVLVGISVKLVFMVLAGLSAAFSAFLIYIQGAVLREWCEYCLVSAGMSILIFIFHFL